MDSEKDKTSMQFIDDMIYIMKDTESDNYIEKLRFDIENLKTVTLMTKRLIKL
ncbi:hypothetical protein H477_4935 [[Clostridium] sordellii ATCC 9714]|nr:hypothetical protein H477_4935 [[Clostridium] sordellii ATCC 9714] [Paeniclostridium sordellii ATCC 9714]